MEPGGATAFGSPHPGSLRSPTLPRWGRDQTAAGQGTLLLRGLGRILDGLESSELDVVELVADLLDLADVDVLHDVARLRIDRDRAARAFPRHALHGADERIALGRAVGFLERRVDEMHAVVAADRH